MKEPDQHFSPDSIDQQTERLVDELPTHDGRMIADLYQTYTPSREQYSRSLQRIWSRFAQAQEHYLPLQEGQQRTAGAAMKHPPVAGSFQGLPQPLPRRLRRSFWNRLSGGIAVAVVLSIVLIWVLVIHTSPRGNPQTTSGASLTLGGAPQFNHSVVFLVKSNGSPQYLAARSFDTYIGRYWFNVYPPGSPLPTNKRTASEGIPWRLVTQQITVVNPPGGLQPYIFGAGQIASVDQPATVLISKATGSQIAVQFNNDRSLATDRQYTVQSYISSATIAKLSTIPLPADAPKLPSNYAGPIPPDDYSPAILKAYLQLPKNLDPRILVKARQVTASAKSMYARAVDLETYLRTNFVYSVQVSLPPGAEGTAWLLFQSDQRASSIYFATAMAVMARELGMPARVVQGYTSGVFDARAQNQVIRDSDAHAWTQIYFAGYGWINFEPSPSFAPFLRLL